MNFGPLLGDHSTPGLAIPAGLISEDAGRKNAETGRHRFGFVREGLLPCPRHLFDFK